MSFLATGLIGLVKNKMAYLGQRQTLLAQNVANSDTPGFKPRDLQPFTFDAAIRQADAARSMSITNVRHIVPASMAGTNSASKTMNSFETLPSGNAVDLEQQMMAVSQTAIDYQATAALYQKFIFMLRTAIGK